ncbi:MAG: hypothetical protein AB1801_13085 [Chloroflexota bacterium]
MHDSSARLLEERLVIAQMAASQLDGLLQRAASELEQAPCFADFDPADADRSAEADILGHVGLFSSKDSVRVMARQRPAPAVRPAHDGTVGQVSERSREGGIASPSGMAGNDMTGEQQPLFSHSRPLGCG